MGVRGEDAPPAGKLGCGSGWSDEYGDRYDMLADVARIKRASIVRFLSRIVANGHFQSISGRGNFGPLREIRGAFELEHPGPGRNYGPT